MIGSPGSVVRVEDPQGKDLTLVVGPRIVFLVSLPSKQFDRQLVKQQVTFDGG